MQITVQFQGASKHFSNPNAVNISFGADDGTTANLNVLVAAEQELVMGAMYEIHIVPVAAVPMVAPVPIQAQAVAVDVPTDTATHA